MRIVFALLFAGFLAVPVQANAAGFSFLLETTYASSPLRIDIDAGGTVNGGVRDTDQQVQQHLSAASVSSAMSLSDVSAISSAAQRAPQVQQKTSSSVSSQKSLSEEESDLEILKGIPAFAGDALPDPVGEEHKIDQGISYSGITEMDETLPPSERAAVLRASIKTVEQMKLFIRALAEDDENIRKIEVIRDRVVVSYRQTAKVLGLFPISYLLETTVEDGEIAVDAPWWLMLSKDGVGDYVKAVEESLLAALDGAELADVDLQDLLQKQQQILQMMSTINKMMHESAKSIISNIRA